MNEVMMSNNNFDINGIMSVLSQTVPIVKSNAESTAVMMKELDLAKQAIGGLVSKVNEIGDGMTVITDRMNNLEQNEEITETQAETLNRKIKKRIAEILGFNQDDIAKYFRPFIFACYKDMRQYHGMAGSYRRTKKRDYQRIIDQVEAWIPSEGIMKLKEKIDKRAEANRKAIQEGYIS
jgi:vacuolar-type H+-ATPase subunit I/STV1